MSKILERIKQLNDPSISMEERYANTYIGIMIEDSLSGSVITLEGILLEAVIRSTRIGASTTLNITFVLPKQTVIPFHEGSSCDFKVNDVTIFKGYCFKTSRDHTGICSALFYDVVRYLKNSSQFANPGTTNVTTTSIIKSIVNKYQLKIAPDFPEIKRDFKDFFQYGKPGLDMIYQLLDRAIADNNLKRAYVFWDNLGTLRLDYCTDLKTDIILNTLNIVSYEVSSDIDNETYTKITMCYDEKNIQHKEYKEVIATVDGRDMREIYGQLEWYINWPVYVDEVRVMGSELKAFLDQMIKYYARPKVVVDITAMGCPGLIAGCAITIDIPTLTAYINPDVEDVPTWAIVEDVRHIYKNGSHLMEITLNVNIAEEGV